MSQDGFRNKAANSLLALSSAAVLAVYAAGYQRTRTAADRFAAQAAVRRPVTPVTLATTAADPTAPAVEAAVHPAPVAPPRQPARRARPRRARRANPAPALAPPATLPVAAIPVNEPAPVAPPPPPAAPEAPLYKDGTYLGWGSSRHGDIQAAVVIENGRIASATIAQCFTRYSCSVIGRLPPQVAERQSPEVDYVSGATQSTNAFYYAVVEALGKAR